MATLRPYGSRPEQATFSLGFDCVHSTLNYSFADDTPSAITAMTARVSMTTFCPRKGADACQKNWVSIDHEAQDRAQAQLGPHDRDKNKHDDGCILNGSL